MFRLFRVFLIRSWAQSSVFMLLYLLAYLQLAFYHYFNEAGLMVNPVMRAGYLIGVFGFLSGISGVQYLISRMFRYEIGNLEMLGFRRITIVAFLTGQYLAVLMTGLIGGILLFQMLYVLEDFQAISPGRVLYVHLLTSGSLVSVFGLSIALFLWLHSRQDPALLIRSR